MEEPVWDVDVAGAGAAGLMAALRAAERGRRVLLLEKNRRPGVKILMSGGTRCNITHDTDNRGIVQAFGSQGKFLHAPLAAFSVDAAIAFFEAEGVATKVEEGGKIFPVSDKAADVLDALLRRLARSGATIAYDEPIKSLRTADAGFMIETTRRALLASKLILCTGGLSFPGSGTTGDGYGFAQSLGHSLVPTRPALAPITVEAPWSKELQGLTLPDVGVKVVQAGRTLVGKRGSLLFAHFGLSGPVVLDVSREVASHPKPTDLLIEIDLLPAHSAAELDAWLQRESLASGKKQLAVVLASELPRRLADVVLTRAGLAADRKAAGLAKQDRASLVRTIKGLSLRATGTLGYRKAEVTAGGVPLTEVDSKTMQSKIVPGLFFAGEVLDLDGPIGGYNFQAAWSTGWLAGSSV